MKKILVILGVSLLIGVFLLQGINRIPTYDENVKSKWSQVINQYKRRADLIPNLIETVKGAGQFEQETLLKVINARKQVMQLKVDETMISNASAFEKFEQSQSQLSSALSRLLVVVERYPDIKTNKNYLALQSQLEGTENRIAVARKDYIDAVQQYNTELRTFPGRLWAAIFYSDMKLKENFTEDESVQSTPKVKF